MGMMGEFHGMKTRIEIPGFLKRWGMNNRMCEVGVRFGHNLRHLLGADPQQLVGIDHWEETGNPAQNDTGLSPSRLEEIYLTANKEFLSVPSVKLIRSTSANTARIFGSEHFDFIFVDADHTYDGCFRDLNIWWDKLRWWGVLAIHDYCDMHVEKNGVDFGVIPAVAAFKTACKNEIRDEWCHVMTDDEYPTMLILKGKLE